MSALESEAVPIGGFERCLGEQNVGAFFVLQCFLPRYSAANRPDRPSQKPLGDLTLRPYSDVVPEARLNVLSPGECVSTRASSRAAPSNPVGPGLGGDSQSASISSLKWL
jgi:hypothetical protein